MKKQHKTQENTANKITLPHSYSHRPDSFIDITIDLMLVLFN